MNWSDFYQAFEQAKDAQRQADKISRQMASILAGRLQTADVGASDLCKLKKELENYNMHTGKWK